MFVPANAAFVAGSAANFGILPNEGRKFIQSQLEYILGRFTGRSFMVGFGEKSPKQPRHAGAYVCLNSLLSYSGIHDVTATLSNRFTTNSPLWRNRGVSVICAQQYDVRFTYNAVHKPL